MLKKYSHFIPLGLIILLMIGVYISGLHHHFSFSSLQSEHEKIKAWVALHPYTAPFLFLSVYLISVILVIPDSTVLTILAGVLFPLPLAILCVLAAETAGATVFFLAVRYAAPYRWYDLHSHLIRRLQKGFKEHGANYILFLRFAHILPFWVTNTAAAYFNVRPSTFIWTTFIGLIPLTLVFTEAGASLDHILSIHGHLSLKAIFTPQIKIAMFLLGLCALLPLFFQKRLKK